MFPHDYVERDNPQPSEDVAAWAKLEGKSATTEQDLLRSSRRNPRVSLSYILHSLLHVVHLLLDFGNRDS